MSNAEAFSFLSRSSSITDRGVAARGPTRSGRSFCPCPSLRWRRKNVPNSRHLADRCTKYHQQYPNSHSYHAAWILALAMGASAFENSYLSQMSQRAVKANTATMDNARVAKDSASYLESLPQASTPTVEAKVAAPSSSREPPALKPPSPRRRPSSQVRRPSWPRPPRPSSSRPEPRPTSRQRRAVHKSNFRRLFHDRLICAQVRRRGGPVPRVGLSHQARGPRRAREGGAYGRHRHEGRGCVPRGRI